MSSTGLGLATDNIISTFKKNRSTTGKLIGRVKDQNAINPDQVIIVWDIDGSPMGDARSFKTSFVSMAKEEPFCACVEIACLPRDCS